MVNLANRRMLLANPQPGERFLLQVRAFTVEAFQTERCSVVQARSAGIFVADLLLELDRFGRLERAFQPTRPWKTSLSLGLT